MGNYTYLTFGDFTEFEAKNCLPVPWLALFIPEDYVVETYEEEGEESLLDHLRTTQAQALQRVVAALAKVKGKPISAYLRPLVVLRDELQRGASGDLVDLNFSQVVDGDEARERVKAGSAAFARLLDAFTGDATADLTMLDHLVHALPGWVDESVADMDAELRMFVLLGWCDGDPERPYSLAYFGDDFWKPIEG